MTSSNHQLRIVGLAAAIFVILGAATGRAQTVRLTWVQTGAQVCGAPTTVDYGPTTSYGTTVTANHSASTFWYDITGQTAGTTLHYRINTCGNTGSDATATVGNSSCPNQAWTGQTDEYGGAIMRCPFGHASGFFHVEKISFNGRSQWWYIDPSGNPFWDRGVQALDSTGSCLFNGGGKGDGICTAGAPTSKYPSRLAWGTAQNERALNWGFNSWDSYMAELPTAPYGWWGAKSGNPVRIETALQTGVTTNATESFVGNAPSAPVLSYVAGAGAPAATYYVETSFNVESNSPVNPYRTGPLSAEASLAVPAGNVLVVQAPSSPYAVSWNVWVGTSTGAESLQSSLSSLQSNTGTLPMGTAWTEPVTGLVNDGSPEINYCNVTNGPQDIYSNVPLSAYASWRGAGSRYGSIYGFPDVYSPAFAQCAIGANEYISNSIVTTGMSGAKCNASNEANCAAPWVKGVISDDADYFDAFKGYGMAGSGLNNYPNIAWLAAVSNFQDVAYSDPVNYTKRAWVNYLQAKYGTISALNTAWGTGGFYTTFGDSGSATYSNVTSSSFVASGSAAALAGRVAGAPITASTVTVQNYYNPPAAPSFTFSTTGGSIPASTTVCVETTYQNESSGNNGETNPSAAVCQQSGSGTNTNEISLSSPTAVLSTDRYGIYACTETAPPAQCTNFTKQLGSSQAINSAPVLTSITTNGVAAPTSNTTSTAGGVLQPEYACTDNGSGTLSGCPAGLNLSASSIGYKSGVISLTFSSAPGQGANYIFSFTGSGYGVGTGVLDEDGRHTAWMGNDPFMLNGTVTISDSVCSSNCLAASSGVVTDVNAFLQDIADQYAKTVAAGLDVIDGNHLLIGPDAIANFGGAPRQQVEAGMAAGGIDVLYTNYGPGCTSNLYSGCPLGGGTVGTNYTLSGMDGNGVPELNGGDKAVYDNSGVPQVIWYEIGAQAGSWWNRPQTVQLGTGNGSTTTFSKTLTGPNGALISPITPNTVSVTAGSATCADNGSGALTGTGCSGTVNYSTNAISVTFTAAPANSTPVNVTASGPLTPGYLFPDFGTQADRALQFQTDVNRFENAQGTNGDYYVIGYEWWQWQDPTNGEAYDEGFVSPYDNAYDGHEDVTGSVACSAPVSAYTCGGEPNNEGDFIDTVRTANDSIYSAILGAAKP